MGRDISEGKIAAPHPKEVMNTEFEISAVSIFQSQEAALSDNLKARQTFL